MRSSPLAAALLLLAAPAFAQPQGQSWGQPQAAPTAPPVYNLEPPPPGAGPAGERRAQGGTQGGAPQAGAGGVEMLVRQADQALSRGAWQQANEFVERAETMLLNVHTDPGSGGRQAGMQEGRALAALSDARQAIGRRDRQTASQALRRAQGLLAELPSVGAAQGTGATQGGATGSGSGGAGSRGQGGAGSGSR